MTAGYKHHSRFKCGDLVHRILDKSIKGMIVAVIIGFKGRAYNVAWTDSYGESQHCEEELELHEDF